MNLLDEYLDDAVAIVLAWRDDLDAEEFGPAVTAQAILMAGYEYYDFRIAR